MHVSCLIIHKLKELKDNNRKELKGKINKNKEKINELKKELTVTFNKYK